MSQQQQARLAEIRQGLEELRRELSDDEQELVEVAERRVDDVLRVCAVCGLNVCSVAEVVGHERREPGHKIEYV